MASATFFGAKEPSDQRKEPHPMTRGERREARRKQFCAKKQASFTDQREIGRVQRNSTTAIVARVLKVDGEPRADLRVFITRRGKETATRRGLCLAVQELPKLLSLINDLCDMAKGNRESTTEENVHE